MSKLIFHSARQLVDSTSTFLDSLSTKWYKGPNVKKWEISLVTCRWLTLSVAGRPAVLLLSGALTLLFRHLWKSWDSQPMTQGSSSSCTTYWSLSLLCQVFCFSKAHLSLLLQNHSTVLSLILGENTSSNLHFLPCKKPPRKWMREISYMPGILGQGIL